jgi:glycosyltransferase A (GT-A) superfamily protein (DUF2064 family)
VSDSIESSQQIVRGQSDGPHTLVIMAKAPKPGMVKTRLARSLPVSAVTALYRCFLDDTLTLARSLHEVKVAVMCPAADREDLVWTVGSAVPVVPQVGNGLAAALCSVFAHFNGAGSNRIVAFNSDSPHLPTTILQAAFRLLDECDVVVGRLTTAAIILWARGCHIQDCSILMQWEQKVRWRRC